MSHVLEKPMFKCVAHALSWAYQMEHATPYPAQSFTRDGAKYNSWTDLSQLDRHAQAAYIRDMVETSLTAPEIAAIHARHGHGFRQLKGIAGLSEHVRGIVKNEGECLDAIVGSLYLCDGDSKRKIASLYSVKEHTVEGDWKYIKGSISSLEKIAFERLRIEFTKCKGLID